MPKTLLLADDSVVIQKLVGLSFANENVKIVATDNGDDAIAKAREVIPDVVLADVVMPGRSGYEVCEEIKQDARLAHVPVLLLTGTFEAFDEGRARQAGADGQITKPFEAQALVERVNEFMNRPAPAPTPTAEPPLSAQAAEEDDFFDPNVTTLSPLDAPPVLDGEPGRTAQGGLPSSSPQPGDPSISGLFGAPGEGAIDDDLELGSGGLALGQAVSPSGTQSGTGASDPDRDRTDPMDANESTRWTSLERAPEASPQPQPQQEELDDFADELALDEPLGLDESFSVSTDDLDAALESDAEDEAPILVGPLDESVVPEGLPAATMEPTPRESSPTAAATAARSDEAGGPVHRETPHANRTPPATPPVDPFDPVAPEAVPEATPLPIAREAHTGMSAGQRAEHEPAELAEPTPPMDFGPASLGSTSLDFGFDVSEQVSADSLPDPLEDSLSAGAGLVPPQIDDPASEEPWDAEPDTAHRPDRGAESTGVPAPERHGADPEIPAPALSARSALPEATHPEAAGSEDFLVGYDVSSSDLAAAPVEARPVASSPTGVEFSDPIPASATALVPPALPPQHAGAESLPGIRPGGSAEEPSRPGSDLFASEDLNREEAQTEESVRAEQSPSVLRDEQIEVEEAEALAAAPSTGTPEDVRPA
ncbi:MAG: response regulator, partial [bacterium]